MPGTITMPGIRKDKRTVGMPYRNHSITDQSAMPQARIDVHTSGMWPVRTITLVAKDLSSGREICKKTTSGAETNTGCLRYILGRLDEQGYGMSENTLASVRHELSLDSEYKDSNWKFMGQGLQEAKEVANLAIKLKRKA